MRWLALLSLLVPATAAADPPPVRGSARIALGAGLDGSIDLADELCGLTERTAFELGGTLGGGTFQLAAAVGYAGLALPWAYCDSDQTHGDGTGYEVHAEVGVAVVTAPGPIRLRARLVGGLQRLHLQTHMTIDAMFGDDGGSWDETTNRLGPVVELAGAVVFQWRRFWLGPEIALGVARPEPGRALGYYPRTGLRATLFVVAGVEIP